LIRTTWLWTVGPGNCQPELLAIPEIDIVTTHHYPEFDADNSVRAQLIQENAAMAKGKKPYIVGEIFGSFPPNRWLRPCRQSLIPAFPAACSGACVSATDEGGFYWHSEPSGGNLYKGFHWPGSTTGAEYDETNLMAITRRYAFAIRGLTPPPIPVPAPPRLLPITDAARDFLARLRGCRPLHRRTRPESGRAMDDGLARTLTKASCNIVRCSTTSPAPKAIGNYRGPRKK